MGFGVIRVINDDLIAPSMGFATHPHDNMEIITILLDGELAHKDNKGNKEVIYPGEVQIMSAGTGIWHSEFNNSATGETKLFQIWIFPDKEGHKPRYDQKMFLPEKRKNKFQLLVSPDDDGDALRINQKAYISRIDLESGNEKIYKRFHEENGIYFLIIDGEAEIETEKLKSRDALGITGQSEIKIEAVSTLQLLIIEVPMNREKYD